MDIEPTHKLQDNGTQTNVSCCEIGCQTEVDIGSNQPYSSYGETMKSILRSEIISQIHVLLQKYSHSENVTTLLNDLTSSRKWKTIFGVPAEINVPEQDLVFLKKLAKDYEACKNKESNKEVRKQAAKLTTAIKIGNSKKSSAVSFDGSFTESAKTRIDAAESIGRITAYGAEKRRLLSIVAMDYPQSLLTDIFKCAKATVTAARANYILFGRGGVPPQGLKFSREVVSQDVLDSFTDFLLRDNISRPSSCRSVVVDGEECAVRYWQDSIKNVIQQYLLEFPDGVKRTYIYSHIPQNFRSNSMLAGLCNICEDVVTTLTDVPTVTYPTCGSIVATQTVKI